MAWRPIAPGPCVRCMRTAACRALIAVLATATLFAPEFACAEPAAAATATAMPPPVATPPTTVTDIVLGMIASDDLQRATLSRLEQAEPWRESADRVAALEARLDALPAGLAATGELIDAITRARALRGLHLAASAVTDKLGAVARQLEQDRRALDADARKWPERSIFLQGDPVPAPILERAGAEAAARASSARSDDFPPLAPRVRCRQ